MKRIEAWQKAFDRAHPALVNCEITIDALLIESWIDMQHGGQGITPADAALKYGPNSVINAAYLPFYDALIAYANKHGLQGYDAMRAVTPGAVLLNTCQAAVLIAHNHGQPPVSPPPERPGFVSARAVWEQIPAVVLAYQSRFYLRAAADLRAAGGTGYAAAIRKLTDLASLETGLTSAQMARAQADLVALDSFFGTPGLNRW